MGFHDLFSTFKNGNHTDRNANQPRMPGTSCDKHLRSVVSTEFEVYFPPKEGGGDVRKGLGDGMRVPRKGGWDNIPRNATSKNCVIKSKVFNT